MIERKLLLPLGTVCAVFGLMSLGGNCAGPGAGVDPSFDAGPLDVEAGPPPTVSGIAAGAYHTCAIVGGFFDNTVQCWGSNLCHQLDLGTEQDRVAPGPVGGNLRNLRILSGGICNTCALDGDNTLQCWGQNTASELGNPDAPSPSEPVEITSSGASSPELVRMGGYFACAKYLDETVKCWGANESGQIGKDPEMAPSPIATPTSVSGLSRVKALCTGEAHACAVVGDDGNVKCWGKNADGQLGGGSSNPYKFRPVQVVERVGSTAPLADVADVACGPRHTCALMRSGDVKCWGANDHGQVGLGRKDGGTTPRVTRPDDTFLASRGDGKVTALCAGGVGVTDDLGATRGFTCAILEDRRTVKCWGGNEHGQLGGVAVDADSDVPVEILDLEDVSALACGGAHVCALVGSTDPRTVRCWGSNQYGQLGTGDRGSTATPQGVRGL